MKRLMCVLVGLSLFLSACGGESGAFAASGSIRVSDAWARAAAAMDHGDQGSTGAVYMVIENTGGDIDRLLKVESDAAEAVELHNTVMEGDVMRMAPVESIDIPAKGKAELKQGGYHIMLVRLKGSLDSGENLHLKLTFERTGALEMDVPVR